MQTESVLLSTLLKREGMYLTGSRFFGNVSPGSDWDFFCQDSEDNRNTLKSLGFKKQILSYPDTNTNEVWRHTHYPIHVQLEKDVNLKATVQQVIARFPPSMLMAFLQSPKVERHEWWNYFYAYYM
jgi:hypothetical protein